MPIASVGVGTTTSAGKSCAHSVATTRPNNIVRDTTPGDPRRDTTGSGLSPFGHLVRVPGMEVLMNVKVVGAGVGGLLTAALLRARGVDAVVVERASKAGGRARSPLLGGLPVNLGPRALYHGGPFEAALRSLGIR